MRSRKVFRVTAAAIGTLVLGGFALFTYLNPGLGPGEPDREILWLTGGAAIVCLVALVLLAITPLANHATKLAIALREPGLRAEGWDTFWGSGEEPSP